MSDCSMKVSFSIFAPTFGFANYLAEVPESVEA